MRDLAPNMTDYLATRASFRLEVPEVYNYARDVVAVAEAPVVGKSDPLRGQIVKAFVVLAPGRQGSDALVPEFQEHLPDRYRPLQVPARGRVHRRAAQDHLRQDPPRRTPRTGAGDSS